MSDGQSLNYGRMMQRALRGLMVEVLGQVAEHGLPGDHHFYIGIDTRHPGVVMADWLRERYPTEIVIVLQDWFEDLAVLGDRFQVTLNFSNQPQTLVIPFDAVLTFIDPSVKFGLKFDEESGGDPEFLPDEGEDGDDDGPGGGPGSGPGGGPSAEVVSLDRFRKG